ncbi:MAG: NTP transferase domain-containing protein [Candidatus Lokiarchaeota archaeon]|nr:NTP transferase domain-containing protein [Candidatus Lokiarchaeota archaeon]
MKAIILCAGYGKRMKPFTDDTQKVMLSLYGKPLLQYIIEGIKFAGIKDFILVVGYLKEQIIDYFNNGSKWGINIEYVIQEKLDGTGGAVLLCEDMIKNNHFFLTWGDILVPYNVYREVYKTFEIENEEFILVANYMEDLQKGCAIYYKNNYCVKMIEKPPKNIEYTFYNNCGIFILSTKIFNILKRTSLSKRGELELTDALNIIISDNKSKIRVIKMKKDQFRGDFGDIKIYKFLSENKKWLEKLLE